MKLITTPGVVARIDKMIADAKARNLEVTGLVLTPEENSAFMEATNNFDYLIDTAHRYKAREKASGDVVQFTSLRKYRGIPVYCVDPNSYCEITQ